MSNIKLVVELGSTNTVIYKMGNGIVLREASLVAVKNGLNVLFEVGNKAKKMLGKTFANINIFSPIENGVIENEEVCIKMFSVFLSKVLDYSIPKNVDVLFCVQNGLSEAELLKYKNVAYACKIRNVDFINVCKASAICAGYNSSNPNATISLNIGGGTVNMATISRGEIIEGYSIAFGGINMDNSIKEYVENVYNHQIGVSTAEKLKIECGSLFVNDTTNMEVAGIDILTKKPQTEIVMANDILIAIEQYFNNIVQSVEQLIKICSPDVVADISNTGIIVSGGVANVTGLEKYMESKLNLKVQILEQPENSVIIGGAMFLSQNE